jgi:hypothetical protein
MAKLTLNINRDYESTILAAVCMENGSDHHRLH